MPEIASISAIAGIILLALVATFFLWRGLYKVPGPDEALVITGSGARLTKEFKEQLEADRQSELQFIKAKTDSNVPLEIDPLAEAVANDPLPEFKIVVGSGTVVRPGQRMERMSLAMQEAEVTVNDVPTTQGIKTTVTAVVLYKVGDRYSTIARAARRFSGDADWTHKIANLLEGHLRAVVGSLPFEEIWRNQEQTARAVRAASSEDMQKLGLQIDSFQLRHIDDPDGYIEDLGAGVRAEAAKNARVARADAEQLAARSEAERAAETAQAQAASEVKQAEVRAEAERAQATADQAKPLAEAQAQQAVIEERTKNATLQAQLTEQELQATVYRQADAEAYQVRTKANASKDVAIAEAEAEAASQVKAAEADAQSQVQAAEASATSTKVQAQAEADAARARAEAVRAAGEADAAAEEARGLASAKVIRETGLAEAQAQEAQGAALAANQEPIIRRAMVDVLPQVVAANAQAYSRIGNLTVLDGMDGVNGGIAHALSAALAMIPTVLDSVRGDDGDGGGDYAELGDGAPGGGSSGEGVEVLAGVGAGSGASGSAEGNAPRPAKGPDAAARAQVTSAFQRAQASYGDLAQTTRTAVVNATPTASGLRLAAGEVFGSTKVAADKAEAAVASGDVAVDALLDATDSGLARADGYVDRAEELAAEASALVDRVGSLGKHLSRLNK